MTYSIVIVTYNSAEYIADLASSIVQQTKQPEQIVVVDNASSDNTGLLVQQHLPTALFLPQTQNQDLSYAANLGIAQTRSDFVCLLNPDLRLMPTALDQLLQYCTHQKTIGAVSPKLLRLDDTGKTTTVIDSMGIVADRSRRFRNLGEGVIDQGQYDHKPVFGLTGAAILFRKTALDDIARHGGGKPHEYLDEQFKAYKDDIDIAYRLRHRGWELCVLPMAVAYHHRSARESTTNRLNRHRSKRSQRINRYSLRNHWWLLLKNEPWQNLCIDMPFILWYEMQKLVFLLFFERSSLTMIVDYYRGFFAMAKKRRAIMDSSKTSKQYLRSWFRRSAT